jgi:exonuclease III
MVDFTCDHMTIMTWNVMGSTTIPDELREIADQKKPWVIVMTETKLTDKTGFSLNRTCQSASYTTAVERATTVATVGLAQEGSQSVHNSLTT